MSGDWRDRAACRGVDPELFFPVGDGRPAVVAQIARAKVVCAGCVVRAECLSFALVWLPEGVAGGLTARERAHQRSRSGVPSASGPAGRRVDGEVVASLMAGRRVSGASAGELARAVVGLHRAGRGGRWIATRLGVDERRVYRWLQRHRAGLPLTARRGARGAGVSA